MKNRPVSVLFFAGAALLLCLALLTGCSPKKTTVDPGFSEYITAFTSGVVSTRSPIRIELAHDVASVENNKPVEGKLFYFSPSVNGKAYWIDNHTIEFRPDVPLRQGTTYNVNFYLGDLLKVPRKFRALEFSFHTINQAAAITVEGFEPYIPLNLTQNKVTGKIETADVAEESEVEKMVTAKQNDRSLKVTWNHNSITNIHSFTLDSVSRSQTESSVTIDWNGKVIGADEKGTETVRIPSVDDFSVLSVDVKQAPQQSIAIRFSQPIEGSQDLTGLIHYSINAPLSFEVDGMTVKAYPASLLTVPVMLTVEKGIESVQGTKLAKSQLFTVKFENLKPAVRFKGKGVVLPDSKGLVLPFETVNIKAVDLRIIKIFEDNVAQFLQVNQLDGNYELKRAGRLILKKTIRLNEEKPVKANQWNLYSLDLARLIKQEPGAIYRVSLSFKKEYASYNCGNNTVSDEPTGNMHRISDKEDQEIEETGYWDEPESYWEGDEEQLYEDYDWNKREDPCSSSYYYGTNTTVSRNVLASNLGIIVRGNSANTLQVVVADLISTKPEQGVEVDVFNFQHQNIGSGKTNGDGFLTLPLKGKPFLLVAGKDKQKGYLRLDDGSALSLSNFDVVGIEVQRGLKGFIYGERGVWRPGDTIYLSFVLEDKLKTLPEDHPVILEVRNPLGQLYKRIVKTSGTNGFYSFVFSTGDNDVTGNWTAYVKVGGTTFTKNLKIETIKPNRLKIQLQTGAGVLKAPVPDIQLNAKWLHGTPAGNLRSDVTVKLTPVQTVFKGFNHYVFDDPQKKFQTEEQVVFNALLDNEGNASVHTALTAGRNAPGMLKATFTTRVFEPGGDFSIDQAQATYSPYTSYVGLKTPETENGFLYNDKDQEFEVASVTPEGSPLDRQNLEFAVYKMEWRWWWDNDLYERANYESSVFANPVYKTTLSTAGGKARVNFRPVPADWGRYLVRVTDQQSGHSTGKIVYFDYPGESGKAYQGDARGATMLMFSTDKKSYKVGEKATIKVPSSKGGRMLVSLETGSEVLKTWWVKTEAGETKATFDITDRMSPNIYIHIALLQPHAQTLNDLPVRMYGVIPVMVEDPLTHITPLISMPDVLRPEKPFTIRIKEKNNHNMTYTLAIVDEGLLDITRYKTPDLWNSFFGREALGIKSWDMYDLVMGAWGGKIESLFAIGGDDDVKGAGSRKATRFKPVVKFLGPFTLKSGSGSHTITLPQYVGSVRVMVVAGDKGAYGNAEKIVPVRMPLMALASLPRVVCPGEDISLPVSVFAMEKNMKNVTVTIIPNELFVAKELKSKTLHFDQTGEQDIAFALKTVSREGIGKVKVLAQSGNEKAEYSIEINVRNPNLKIVQYSDAVLSGGKLQEIKFNLFGIPGTNRAALEVSSIPPVDLSRRLQYLLEYPYGCAEQITSAAFPQLYLGNFITLDQQTRDRSTRNITAAILRINSLMLPEGGICYWSGAKYPNAWVSSYAGHFMIEAENAGYSLPSGFKSNWLKFQRKEARSWQMKKPAANYLVEDDDLCQAYRLYTLSLAKSPEIGAMNRMKETAGLSVAAAWRLAAAYAIAGQPETAKQLLFKAGSQPAAYQPFNPTFGSVERDWAMMLETQTILNNKTQAFQLLRQVSDALSKDAWMSTQTTAYSLLAVSKFLQTEKTTAGLEFTYSAGMKKNVRVISKSPVITIPLDNKVPGQNIISIQNPGKGTLFVRVVSEGIPETGLQKPSASNLQLAVLYKSAAGKPLDVTRLQQGSDFVLEVTVKNLYQSGRVTNLALKQVFASGWEISNERVFEEATAVKSDNSFTYQDIRDDRVYTFFDLAIGESKTFKIRLNASYAGKFYLPGALCEAMYEPGINAFISGSWVEVVK